jgi:hypothetical protein
MADSDAQQDVYMMIFGKNIGSLSLIKRLAPRSKRTSVRSTSCIRAAVWSSVWPALSKARLGSQPSSLMHSNMLAMEHGGLSSSYGMPKRSAAAWAFEELVSDRLAPLDTNRCAMSLCRTNRAHIGGVRPSSVYQLQNLCRSPVACWRTKSRRIPWEVLRSVA